MKLMQWDGMIGIDWIMGWNDWNEINTMKLMKLIKLMKILH